MRGSTTTLQSMADKAAIGFSVLCAVHCVALPAIAAVLPSLLALGLDDETFHTWLVIVVIPLSAFALTLGCCKHREMNIVCIGVMGLLLLCLVPFLGHELLGEYGERLFTLAGALLIAVSHVKNFLLCRRTNACECPDQN